MPTSATTISTSNGLLLSVKMVPSCCAYQFAMPRAVTSFRSNWYPVTSAYVTPAWRRRSYSL